MADKKLIIGVDVQIGNAKANLEQLRDAAVKFGDDGAKHADGLTRSLQSTENAINSYERKLTETGNVGERDIIKIVRAIEAMKAQGVAAFGSLANAPKEFTAALDAAEHKLAQASTTVGRINNAVKDNAAHVQAAANNWSGLGNALEGAGGKLGTFVGKWGLVTAAFNEGWSLGQKLNSFFRTDMSEWNHIVEDFGTRANIIIRGVSDVWVAAWKLQIDLMRGHFAEAKRDYEELKTAGVDAWNGLKHAVTDGSDALNKYAVSQGVATKATLDNADATKKLKEEKDKLNEEIKKVVRSLKDETFELEKQKKIHMDADHQVVQLGGDLGYLKRAVDDATRAQAAQNDELQTLTQRYGENDPMVIQARTRLEQLDIQIRSSTQRYDAANEALRTAQDRYKDSGAAIIEHTKKQADLQKELGKDQTELGKTNAAIASVTGVTQAAATATDAHATALHKAIGHIQTFVDGQGKIHIVMEQTQAATTPVTKEFQTLNDELERAIQNYASLIEITPQMAQKMGELAAAAAMAANGGGSVKE